jgi:hypothetical protein
MKPKIFALKSFFLLVFFNLVQMALWAQDQGSSSTTSTSSSSKTEINVSDSTGTEWYTSPWVWIVGAALFILLLVALLSGRGSDTVTRDRVTVKKVVERD